MTTESIAAAIETIATSKKLDRAPWAEFSLVITIAPDGWLSDNFGYSFTDEGPPNAFSSKNRQLQEPVQAYLDSLYPDGNYPVRMLVQFNRDSGRYNVDFEDSDTTRWAITPANLDQAREALRPNLVEQ